MKRFYYYLLLLSVCCFLYGCGFGGTQDPSDRESEGAQTTSEITSEMAGSGALSEEEIAWFQSEFFNAGEGVSMRNMMLSSQYRSVEDIDLYRLFYNGITETAEEVTEEERTLLSELDTYAKAYASNLDVIKVTAARMDAFLQEYAGLGLEDTAKNGLDQFLYLEEYDAYYLIHGDMQYVSCTVLSGTRNEDGTVSLEYETDGGTGIVTLKESDGGYWFVSNTDGT